MPRKKMVQGAKPETANTVEVVIMRPNMWWDGVKHWKRDRLTMPRKDAERLIAEDQEAERDERILIL